MTTDTALTDGTRHDVTARFLSRRAIDTDDGPVHRLVVDRGDDRLALFVAGDRGQLAGLRTGDRYRFADVLGCAPLPPPPADDGTGEDCPDCGGTSRPGLAVDGYPAVRAAVEQLDVDASFGVVDDRTRVDDPDDERERVDDWRPMVEPPFEERPESVCRRCGAVLDAAHHPGKHLLEAMDSAPATDELGLTTGGARDVANFRENVRQGCVPQPDAITEAGLFADYHFATDGTGPDTDALFSPRYAGGASDHPVTGRRERYLAVGLDADLTTDAFRRPPLDLVVVLDVSGSMNHPFDEYYYDEHGRERTSGADDRERKIDAATRSVCALTHQLDAGDRLGVVLFNDRAHVAKPLRAVGDTDVGAVRSHVRDVVAGGGTNMAAGFRAATELLADADDRGDAERRIVFMTDAMPNVGTTGEADLADLVADAAADGVHTTFVGMGIDANADLVESLSGVRGANHCFVHSGAEFERRLGEAFDHMVTPLVFDLGLRLEGGDYEVAGVHGAPGGDAGTGQLLDVGTLFPSAKEDGETRGGIVLVRLRATDDAGGEAPALVAAWTERDGTSHTERVSVDVPDAGYDHDGVRKAVALSRYARALRSWAGDVHDERVADDPAPERGEHERRSVPLVVPDDHAERLAAVGRYLAREAEALDEDVTAEVDVLERLLDVADADATIGLEGEA